MKCTDCVYYYKIEGDAFPYCHFEGPVGWAPCEQEEEPEEEDRYTYDDLGYNWY